MPGILGICGPLATQDWHCQGLLARWRVFLALPGITGAGRVFATRSWHCQGLLAFAPSAPRGLRAPGPVTKSSFDPNASS